MRLLNCFMVKLFLARRREVLPFPGRAGRGGARGITLPASSQELGALRPGARDTAPPATHRAGRGGNAFSAGAGTAGPNDHAARGTAGEVPGLSQGADTAQSARQLPSPGLLEPGAHWGLGTTSPALQRILGSPRVRRQIPGSPRIHPQPKNSPEWTRDEPGNRKPRHTPSTPPAQAAT